MSFAYVSIFIAPFIWAWRSLSGYFEENYVSVVKLFPSSDPKNLRIESVSGSGEILFMCDTITLPWYTTVEINKHNSESGEDGDAIDVIKFIAKDKGRLVYLYKPLPKNTTKLVQLTISSNHPTYPNAKILFKSENLNNSAFIAVLKNYFNQ